MVAYDYAVWRVISIQRCPEEKWTDRHREEVQVYGPNVAPMIAVLRPAGITSHDVRARDHDKHFFCTRLGLWQWQVYPDEHYPVCASCSGPLPCREKEAERVAQAEIAQMGRYEIPGICPACREVVTSRQRSVTFPENLELPGGPPVTFHLRGECFYVAGEYEKRWVAADPGRRRCTLTCRGHVTNHGDGTYDCTALDDCPGPGARHTSYQVCHCPGCRSLPGWDCNPRKHAVRRPTR